MEEYYQDYNDTFSYNKYLVEYKKIEGGTDYIKFAHLDDMERGLKIRVGRKGDKTFLVEFPATLGAFLITQNKETVKDAFRCSLGRMEWDMVSDGRIKRYYVKITELKTYKEALDICSEMLA